MKTKLSLLLKGKFLENVKELKLNDEIDLKELMDHRNFRSWMRFIESNLKKGLELQLIDNNDESRVKVAKIIPLTDKEIQTETNDFKLNVQNAQSYEDLCKFNPHQLNRKIGHQILGPLFELWNNKVVELRRGIKL